MDDEFISTMGGCLCGAIRYEVDGELTNISNCHCGMCRQQSGAAFSTFAAIDSDGFQWVSGEEQISQYESSPGGFRIFCKVCGSILGVVEDGSVTMISLGSVSGDPGVRPAEHIFVGSKAPWYEIRDDLPQYLEWPPSD